MDSASERAVTNWARPSEELLQRLWRGKAQMHALHANLSLPEKVRLVVELQRMVLPLIARQRPLHPWAASSLRALIGRVSIITRRRRWAEWRMSLRRSAR